MQIWKFPLINHGVHVLSMPAGAQPLHVGEQDGQIMLWALVLQNENQAKMEFYTTARTFFIVGTGAELPHEQIRQINGGACRHVGTVLKANGNVFHVFDGGWN